MRAVRLEVEDQGRGVPREMLDESGNILPGLGVGIAGMQERMHLLGGRLEIRSSGHGTVIVAIIPVP